MNNLTAPASSVKLHLRVTDSGGEGGSVQPVSTEWGEGTITYDTAPSTSAAALAFKGPVSSGTTVEFDLGRGAVPGNGSYSFAITSANTNEVHYSSKEGSNPPQLVVTQEEPTATSRPDANFTAEPMTAAVGQPVGFRDASTNGPTSWAWDFGDEGANDVSTSQNPTYTYTRSGTYTVSLTASNGAGSDVETKTGYVTVELAGPSLTFVPVADARVSAGSPSSNYGTSPTLRARGGSSPYKSFLKFDVQGLTAPATSVKLRLWVTDASPEGGKVRPVADTIWGESTITNKNAPSTSAPELAAKGAVKSGTTVEFDLGPGAVAGNGLHTFAITSSNTDSVYYSSREGSTPLQLAVGQDTTTSVGDPVLVGAGDIASCSSPGDEATANLLDQIPGSVFTVGDNAYQSGTASEFAQCYEPSWGRHRARTRPAVGNHEYRTTGASGHYGYFGAAAGEPGKGYYSYDLGTWTSSC